MKVQNIFVRGVMNSDIHYSLIDNKTAVRVENLRISGEGNDGAYKTLKGSELVSNQFTQEGDEILNIYEGKNNKAYYFIANKSGKSGIIEYDVETKETKKIALENSVLRFDEIRWENGNTIFPYKYLLSVNQIDNLLFFSNEKWRYPRFINLERLEDYSSLFTEEDIITIKKPPILAPNIIGRSNDTPIEDKEKKNKFVSFFYRYKYTDGSFSSPSFYTEASFETEVKFGIDSARKNKGMQNLFKKVILEVNTGGKNVTDIEVFAREHGSNTAYIIYNVNKKEKSLTDNSTTTTEYSYSKNYQVLDERTTNLLYTNCPMFPKAQENVGNRMFYGNFIEGFDLVDINGEPVKINYHVKKIQTNYVEGEDNRTTISLFSNKVCVFFYNDYNQQTTALLATDQNDTEVDINFEDRLKVNKLQVVFDNNFKVPAFATKMKFGVRSENPLYENIYFNNVKKIGKKVYFLLTGDSVNKVKKGDYIFFTKEDIPEYEEFLVEEYGLYRKIEDGVPKDGFYAVVIDERDLLNFDKNAGKEARYRGSLDEMWMNIPDTEDTKFYERPFVFTDNMATVHLELDPTDASDDYTSLSYEDLNYGQIFNGDEVEVNLGIQFYRRFTGTFEQPNYLTDYVELKKETLFSDGDYPSVTDFLVNNFHDYKFEVHNSSGNILIITTYDFQEFMKNYPNTNTLDNVDGKRVGVVGILEIKVNRGVIGGYARTKNPDNVEDQNYYETDKTYLIENGIIIPDSVDGFGRKVFDIDFYNGYTWGNGVESYKIRDEFNGKFLRQKFRGSAYEIKGYKEVHRKNDVTWGGLYNYEMGLNELNIFNPSLANWKELPTKYGEIQRLVSTDNNLTAYCNNKIMLLMYEKSILYDLTGSENVALSDEVLGAIRVLDYEYGIGTNPESIAISGNLHYLVDPIRKRFLVKAGNEVQEINPDTAGFFNEGIKLLSEHQSLLGYYDDAHSEYVVNFDHQFTLSYSLANKGFRSYFRNKGEFNSSMNGKSFTAWKGTLYQNEVTDNQNDFAGQGKFEPKLVYVVNPEMDSDKVFLAQYLQSNHAWHTKIKTNLYATEFPEKAYTQKESFFYSEIYRDNSSPSKKVGAGRIQSIADGAFIYSQDIDIGVCIGDTLVSKETDARSVITYLKGDTLKAADPTGFGINNFTYAEKKQVGGFRPSGDPIRGKWMEVTLTTMPENEEIYIIGVDTEVIKSNL